jgi:ketosteroid isomerase-like protein
MMAKDAEACAAFYADDGRIMPPNAPAAEGPKAIAEVWKGLFQLKDFSLTFEPSRIAVAGAADVAYDIGTYSLSFVGEQGPVQDRGKYVVVWKKVQGDWKVAADIFNSDGPTPAP